MSHEHAIMLNEGTIRLAAPPGEPPRYTPEVSNLPDNSLPDSLRASIRRVICWSAAAIIVIIGGAYAAHHVLHSLPGNANAPAVRGR